MRSFAKPHSQKAQRTELLGVRLFPEVKNDFKDFAEGMGTDMSRLAYDALREKYPHIFPPPQLDEDRGQVAC
jgi:hypothetical protein